MVLKLAIVFSPGLGRTDLGASHKKARTSSWQVRAVLSFSFSLPSRVCYQVIRIYAAQAGCHIPTRGCAERRLIRRCARGGCDDDRTFPAFPPSARQGAARYSGITLTFVRQGHGGHHPGGWVDGRCTGCLSTARVNGGAGG